MEEAVPTSRATKPLLDAARAARRSAVLRQASDEFRRKGVAAADLPQIARAVGLSRASLYNYCSGREDLARQCYLDALDALDGKLAQQRNAPANGLDRVVGFVRSATGQDRPIAAIAAELDLLPKDTRAEIEERQTGAFEDLAALITEGQADGSIRACDPALVARSIWGMIFWAPLGEIWAGRAEENLAQRIEAEIPGLVAHGIVSDAARPRRRPPIDAAVFDEIRQSRPDDRVETIARAASSLFNSRGIEGVSLDDVAAEIGATKGLVYHHFASKAALVRYCFDRAFAIYDRILNEAETAPDGLEQSRRGIAFNAMAQMYALHPMSLTAFYHRLPQMDQMRFNQRTAALLDRAIAAARRGIDDGSKRSFDVPAVALASAGSFLFVGRWLPKNRYREPTMVGAEVADFFCCGLAARP